MTRFGRDDLLAVDPQVDALAGGSAGDDERPGDERSGVSGPAGLDGEAAEIDVAALKRHRVPRRGFHRARRHVEDAPEGRERLPGVSHSPGRIGGLEEREQLADLA